MPIILAAFQLLFFWVFIILYIFAMVPLAIVVAFLSPVEKREKEK